MPGAAAGALVLASLIGSRPGGGLSLHPPPACPRGPGRGAWAWLRSCWLTLLRAPRGQGHDLHEVALAQLARDRSKHARAAWVHLLVNDHGRVVVEADVR